MKPQKSKGKQKPKRKQIVYSSDESSSNVLSDDSEDDDINAFTNYGSKKSKGKDSKALSPTESRTITLMVLANHRSLDNYDTLDGPEPTSYSQIIKMPDVTGWQGAID